MITIANGTLADPLVKADVTATNLPAGLDYSVTRDGDTQLTVTISGNATNHANANDVSNLTFTIAQAKVTGATGNLTTAPISIDFSDPEAPAASIASTNPTSLTEAAANDGSLASGAVVITIANGTLADPLVKADVTATNLPAGLDYSVTRDGDTQLTVTISGNATNHANANDVSNLTFTIAQAKVTGATGNLTTAPISIDFNDPAAVTGYTVTFISNGSVYTTRTVNTGDSIGSASWPADPTRSSYIFGGWFTGENGAGTQFISSMPATASMTVYAKWAYSGGGGGSNSSTSSTPTYKADVKAGNGDKSTFPVTVDKEASAAFIDVGSQNLDQGGNVTVTMPSLPGVTDYTVGMPVANLITPDGSTLTFDTDTGSLTLPSDMLSGITGAEGKKAEITIGVGNKSDLSDDVKAAIGEKPLISLTLTLDGKQTNWSNPDAPVTVSIPYTPTAAELANPESIVIWYIDGSGNVVTIPNGHYDPATRMVTFETTHFSDYAVAYNKVSYNDVVSGAWYSQAVSFIAAREITKGTGSGNYSAEAKLTRGEFLVLIMRAYGIAPDENPTDNFSDAGNAYYTGYLAAAKRLGISAGIGNNMYAPDKEITRQEMFTLLYNVLQVMGQLPQGESGKTLSDFTDQENIAEWAKDAMMLLVENGTVGGSNGALAPLSTTTRAEMAQVLYNLLGK